MCIDIAREAMRMHAEGVALADIRRSVEQRFGPERGERAPTPRVPRPRRGML